MKENQYSNIDFADNNAVTIDSTAKIYPNVYFIGECKVGANTIIYPNTTIINSTIGANCVIKCSVIEDSTLQDNITLGPFAHLRPKCEISNNCKIGNFVEIKNSFLGEGSKASHLAYIGDAQIGKHCNIGCGAIFVNYDGNTKSKISLGDNCFVGSNCNLIAPLKVAENNYICAGTTLTLDTQPFDFVIGRNRETIRPNLAQRYLKK